VFGINSWELALLALLFVMLFGPDRLPEIASQVGRMLAELRRATEEATAELTQEFEAAAREAKKTEAALREAGDAVTRGLTAAAGPPTGDQARTIAPPRPTNGPPSTPDAKPATGSAPPPEAGVAGGTAPDEPLIGAAPFTRSAAEAAAALARLQAGEEAAGGEDGTEDSPEGRDTDGGGTAGGDDAGGGTSGGGMAGGDDAGGDAGGDTSGGGTAGGGTAGGDDAGGDTSGGEEA